MAKTFEWKDEYSIGIDEIDGQHKQFIDLIASLYDAINQNKTAEVLGGVIDELIEYGFYHFSVEENYFKEFGYELAGEHAAEHRIFSQKITDLQKQYKNYEIEISFDLVDFLEDWLIKHIMSADRKYVACFRKHGIK